MRWGSLIPLLSSITIVTLCTRAYGLTYEDREVSKNIFIPFSNGLYLSSTIGQSIDVALHTEGNFGFKGVIKGVIFDVGMRTAVSFASESIQTSVSSYIELAREFLLVNGHSTKVRMRAESNYGSGREMVAVHFMGGIRDTWELSEEISIRQDLCIFGQNQMIETMTYEASVDTSWSDFISVQFPRIVMGTPLNAPGAKPEITLEGRMHIIF